MAKVNKGRVRLRKKYIINEGGKKEDYQLNTDSKSKTHKAALNKLEEIQLQRELDQLEEL